MTTLASRLKQKLDHEKSKSPVKRPPDDTTTSADDPDDTCPKGEKIQKLEVLSDDKCLEDNDVDESSSPPNKNPDADDNADNADESSCPPKKNADDREDESNSPPNENPDAGDNAEDKADKSKVGKLSLEDWKLEKARERNKALESDRAKIRKRIPREVKQELRKLENQCKTGKPPTPANFKIFTNHVLVDLLRYNDRSSQNATTKPDLAAAVCDSLVNGTPPRCPKCENSMLRFSCGKKKYGKRYYWCPGYMSGTKFYGCGFKANREDITRNPWIAPK